VLYYESPSYRREKREIERARLEFGAWRVRYYPRETIKLAGTIEIELFRAGNVEPRRSVGRIQSGEILGDNDRASDRRDRVN